ncbi:21178_t:CDS:2 [Cetraspora pellucida]|uniref:21178_t:CDS:1 n=1 Tax=Cetraspora pellucida TaxID=1433469 RepID=A0A9N9NJ15_9GLOM|nr:21178_t:CDS:2 [Cetraspora pellucida]
MFYEEEISLALLAIKVKSEKLQKPDDEDLFDNFKFDDKNLDKPDKFLTDQYSKLELTEEKEESVIKKLKKNLNNEAIMNNQKNHMNNILSQEVDIFAKIVDNPGQTLAYIHKINTKSAFMIKQVLYCAASNICSFIKNKIEKLKAKGLVKESTSP